MSLPVDVAERARLICVRLSGDVAKVCPPGIGHWDRAWEIVAAPSADFMAALSAWERDPTNEATKNAVRSAYAATVEAWRFAASEYEAAGGTQRRTTS